MEKESYSKSTGTPRRTTTDLSKRGKEWEGVLVPEWNIYDSVVSEGRDRVESSDLLPTALPAGRDEETGVFARESTRSPETTGGIDERFPLGREISVTGRDTEEEGVVRFQDVGSDDWVARLGSSVHLSEDLFGKGLGDSDERSNISNCTNNAAQDDDDGEDLLVDVNGTTSRLNASLLSFSKSSNVSIHGVNNDSDAGSHSD